MGFLPWLYHLPQQARRVNPYIQRIERLATDDRATRARLLQTLEVYLDCGNNASETARALGIHRNTLTYRLKQIEHICGVSLVMPDVRLNLQIAIKAYRLQTDGQSGDRSE
jgi:purine catabolism regulator